MSKDKDGGLEALRDAKVIRCKITEVLRTLSLQFQKRIEKLEETLTNAETYEEIQKAKEDLRKERFNYWLVSVTRSRKHIQKLDMR